MTRNEPNQTVAGPTPSTASAGFEPAAFYRKTMLVCSSYRVRLNYRRNVFATLAKEER
jgi:hypothetical protein